MLYCTEFGYRTNQKNLTEAPQVTENRSHSECVVAFIHGEAEDTVRAKKVLDKLVKNLKWLAGKLNTRKIVLHSFAHLSNSKAPAEFVQDLFNQAQSRLQNAGYEVAQTPFGYFLDLDIKAPGFSLARVFKDL